MSKTFPKVVVVSFFVSLAITLFVQLVALPHLFPSLHAGHGLLIGNDSVHLHQESLKIAEDVRKEGWKAWPPPQTGQPVRSLIAALYYFSGPRPYLFAPFQCLAFAFAVGFLFLLFSAFTSKRVALLATLPFAAAPSALVGYSQLLKNAADSFASALLLCSWVLLIQETQRKRTFSWRWLVGIALGQYLVAYSRPYLSSFILASSFVILFVLIVQELSRGDRSVRLLLLWSFAVVFQALYFPHDPKYEDPGRNEVPQSYRPSGTPTVDGSAGWSWRPTPGIPGSVDRLMYGLSRARFGFIYDSETSGTAVDTHVIFRSAPEILRYLPRALQLALFSPFPNQWTASTTHSTSRFFRIAGALETFLLYLCLPFAVLLLKGRHRELALWFVAAFCIAVMWLQSLVIVNVGTLFLHRFVFRSLLAGLGVIGAMNLRDNMPAR